MTGIAEVGRAFRQTPFATASQGLGELLPLSEFSGGDAEGQEARGMSAGHPFDEAP